MKIKTLIMICGFSLTVAHAADKKPNILWIVTDDQRPDSLQCYNRAVYGTDESPLGYVESPNIDALAEEGVLFTRAICNSPACGPSRGSMHTGRYPFRNGHYGFELSHQHPDFVTPVVHQTIREYGYSTGVFGKSDSYIYNDPGSYGNDGIFGTKVHFKHDLQKNGFGDIYSSVAGKEIGGKYKVYGSTEKVMYPDGSVRKYLVKNSIADLTDEEIAEKKKTDEELGLLRAYSLGNKTLIYGGRNPQPADKTVDAWIAQTFINYLENADKSYTSIFGSKMKGVPTDKPFLIDVGFRFPHTPVLAPQSYRDRFADKVYRLPEFDPKDLDKLPSQLKQLTDQMRVIPRSPEDVDAKKAFTPADMQMAIRDYYAFCAHGDEHIGRTIDAFKAYCKKQKSEYLIIYTVGDHGWQLGEQGMESKFSPWRESIHNAAIVVSSDKNAFPPGSVCDELVEYVDFAPTILAAGGVNIQDSKYDYLDGQDLAAVLKGKAQKRDYALGEMNLVIGPRAYMRAKEWAFSMKTRPFWGYVKEENMGKDIKWALECPVKDAELALYDLRNDPLERNNVAADPEYKELAEWFRRKLGNIVLGDGRAECDWKKNNVYTISNFAKGADDKKLDIPAHLIPTL
ncbi:sulfatase-like hydrolase/transferase [Pontiellaceae bacterium B12227]|nr:sulfatase-like hydrolase/transferase [Pontiellaceae bacterium B12227]